MKKCKKKIYFLIFILLNILLVSNVNAEGNLSLTYLGNGAYVYANSPTCVTRQYGHQVLGVKVSLENSTKDNSAYFVISNNNNVPFQHIIETGNKGVLKGLINIDNSGHIVTPEKSTLTLENDFNNNYDTSTGITFKDGLGDTVKINNNLYKIISTLLDTEDFNKIIEFFSNNNNKKAYLIVEPIYIFESCDYDKLDGVSTNKKPSFFVVDTSRGIRNKIVANYPFTSNFLPKHDIYRFAYGFYLNNKFAYYNGVSTPSINGNDNEILSNLNTTMSDFSNGFGLIIITFDSLNLDPPIKKCSSIYKKVDFEFNVEYKKNHTITQDNGIKKVIDIYGTDKKDIDKDVAKGYTKFLDARGFTKLLGNGEAANYYYENCCYVFKDDPNLITLHPECFSPEEIKKYNEQAVCENDKNTTKIGYEVKDETWNYIYSTIDSDNESNFGAGSTGQFVAKSYSMPKKNGRYESNSCTSVSNADLLSLDNYCKILCVENYNIEFPVINNATVKKGRILTWENDYGIVKIKKTKVCRPYMNVIDFSILPATKACGFTASNLCMQQFQKFITDESMNLKADVKVYSSASEFNDINNSIALGKKDDTQSVTLKMKNATLDLDSAFNKFSKETENIDEIYYAAYFERNANDINNYEVTFEYSGNIGILDNEYGYVNKDNYEISKNKPTDISNYISLTQSQKGLPIKFETEDGEYSINFDYNLNSKTVGSSQTYSCKFKVNSTTPPPDDPTPPPSDPDPDLSSVIYRTISLENPFPGKNGNGRTPGANWNDSSYIDSTTGKVKSQSGLALGNELYKTYAPLYVIKLNVNNIKEIRTYNNSHSYDNFEETMNCHEGYKCFSMFLRGSLKNDSNKFETNLLTKETKENCLKTVSSEFDSCAN